jgi:hypothetical protein
VQDLIDNQASKGNRRKMVHRKDALKINKFFYRLIKKTKSQKLPSIISFHTKYYWMDLTNKTLVDEFLLTAEFFMEHGAGSKVGRSAACILKAYNRDWREKNGGTSPFKSVT